MELIDIYIYIHYIDSYIIQFRELEDILLLSIFLFVLPLSSPVIPGCRQNCASCFYGVSFSSVIVTKYLTETRKELLCNSQFQTVQSIALCFQENWASFGCFIFSLTKEFRSGLRRKLEDNFIRGQEGKRKPRSHQEERKSRLLSQA